MNKGRQEELESNQEPGFEILGSDSIFDIMSKASAAFDADAEEVQDEASPFVQLVFNFEGVK